MTTQLEDFMQAAELMTSAVQSCRESDNLQHAAGLMWQHDCGVLPVVDSDNRVIGMVTDRDICMAAYTQGRPLSQIAVSIAMAKNVQTAHESDSVQVIEALMRAAQVRRIPVVDNDWRLRGIVTMNDLARHAHRSFGRKGDSLSGDSVTETLAAICAPRRRAQQSAA